MEKPYLAACTIYRDAASYLAEWIEFHRLVGVERFFLYDNGSVDDHRDVLAPYVEDGIVVVHDWPMPFIGRRGIGGALQRAFDNCLGAHREDSRWIAFLDLDEFLFSPTGAALSELLPGYEEYAAVCVSRAEFGTSGHRTRPDGLVIENFVHRRPVRPDDHVPVKCIVDPRRTVLSRGPHTFDYRQGSPVDEHRRPVEQLDAYGRKPVSWSKFRIHHYGSKSEEEVERKTQQWQRAGSARAAHVHGVGPRGELDETLTAYGPPVREAIRRARGR
jgi:glycosyltransferase involved in cell wall biosynthesis